MRPGQKRLLAALAGLWIGALSDGAVSAGAAYPGESHCAADAGGAALAHAISDAEPDAIGYTTPTATLTLTPTATETPLPSPTLATRVLVITAQMVGAAPSSPVVQSVNVTVVPPLFREPLPDATDSAPPYRGWYSFESDNPAIQYQGTPWQSMLVPEASRGEYHRSEDTQSFASFRFVGSGLRVRYVAASNLGKLALVVDGQTLDTIDAYAPTRIFPGTRVYPLTDGAHVLQIQPTGQKNPQSSGYAVGLDAIQVYRGSGQPVVAPPQATLVPSATPQRAQVKLIAAPPTVQPTVSPLAPSEQTVTLVIAYDENGNHAVDPAEGVRDVSVRVLDAQTNRVLASGFTDASGFVSLTVTTDAPARLVAPYFGETWELPVGRGSRETNFTLLLAPGNQPGLIP